MTTVTSRDGTRIAYDRRGNGPALILVDGALCSRSFGPTPDLAPLLAERFTVLSYDRRGRGDSTNDSPYSKACEVEDIAALITAAGGQAILVGLSSGAALSFEAAASGLPVRKVIAYEPPFMIDDAARHREANHEQRLRTLVAEGRRGAAVKYFMRDMVGVPAVFVLLMQLMRGTWKKLEAVAHTLPHDAAVMGDWSLPAARLAQIAVPTVVMHGGKTDARLKKAALAAAAAIPGAKHRELPGQTHNVKPRVLAQAVIELAGD
jgi:pimeloyl-ACP methyl ester carboxylesterase